MSDGWQFYVDRGGTFTDVVARDPGGALHVQKLLSEDPERYPDAALEAIRRALGGTLDPEQVEVLRMGTTVATNALLERQGARIALLITAGLEDLLRIGTQERPDLFALQIEKPSALAEVVLGVDEEHDAAGRVLKRLDRTRLRRELERLKERGIEAIAIAFKHAHLEPSHELAAAEVAGEVGFRHVALSHQAGGEIGLLARGDTACADAYLTPALWAYLDRVAGALSSGKGKETGPLLRFMKSSGGLAAAADFSGKDAILSGPAGGVVGAQAVADKAGLERVIAFDMGGTSTDVSRIDLREGPERVYERTIAGVRLQAPSLAVHTIAAGGGSRIGFDGRRLQVGPESAGAYPGPVCYRRPGGVLSVTDANAVLGRVQPEHFPACFGPEGAAPLDPDASRAAFQALLSEVEAALAEGEGEAPPSVEALAAGCVRIANEAMAGAIREISVAKGHDLADYALVSFGGAGAQHACAVAGTLGIERVLVPQRSGVLSAWGIGLAPLTQTGVQSFLEPLEASVQAREETFRALEKAGRKALMGQGVKAKGLHFRRSADLRYAGVDATITVAEPPPESTASWGETFARAHRRLYGFDRPGHPVEVKTLRVETVGERAKKKRQRRRKPVLDPVTPGAPLGQASVWFERLSPEGERTLAAEPTPIYERSALEPGTVFQGPALIAEAGSTVVVEPSWSARIDREGQLVLERIEVAEEVGADPSVLAGLDADEVEAWSELCRCMLEGVPSLEGEAWEGLLAQAEAMEIPAPAAEHLARATARELGVLLPEPSVAADPLAGQDPDLLEAWSELCRCMLEDVPSLEGEAWEGLLAQAEAMELSLPVAEHVARACAAELGVVVPAPSGGDPLAGVDPDLVEAFDELCRCLLEDVSALDEDGWAGLLEQAEGMELPLAAAQARARLAADELGVNLPAGAVPAGDERPQERLGQLEAPDPVQLEIMANLFSSIAEQMGATLRRVSLSVNIKERLDFSCAVFDAQAGLVANAPHIPVHLGAMAESVRALQASRGSDLRPGDVLLSNDPFHGGSHLPDVTLVTPVFHGGRLVFFCANRGHHADVGGIVPGSMPANSRSIEEEGVRLHDVLVVREGRFLREELRQLLEAGPHPVRGVEERLADFEAQVAANAQGARLLGELVGRYGVSAVEAYMGHVQRDAAAAMREAIAALPDGVHAYEDYLDDGARIAVQIEVKGDQARIDFSGTAPQLSGNLNAPRAVVLAAVLYVFRTLTSRPIPLNSGCFEPLTVEIPAGSLLDPQPPAAVVGGNVETSQRVVDVLYGALGALGASQGTMNNLTFGRADLGYYETICGGAGAGFGFDGASAVHTHMTNTRITDPEVLERRFPVRLRRFALREGSGGAGCWRGGEGAIRELEFTAPVSATILSERRALGPPGAHGAGSGAPGRNTLIRGSRERQLPAKVQLELSAGDRLRLETPGGGGYDPSPREWAGLSAREARALFRAGRGARPTAGVAQAHVQANLVVLPVSVADDFEEFCRQNPEPCPLLERLAPGAFAPALAPEADLRTDLPRYRIHTREGARDVGDLSERWSEDWVAFLLGCSFTAEGVLSRAGFSLRHVEHGLNVPMYRTDRQVRTVGPFGGRLVVSMRPFTRDEVEPVTELTAPLWHAHGGPVHIGDVGALGIEDLARPDWGDAVPVAWGERPVFWACGVTSQEALRGALEAGVIEEAWTHAPGHMFVADATPASYEVQPA